MMQNQLPELFTTAVLLLYFCFTTGESKHVMQQPHLYAQAFLFLFSPSPSIFSVYILVLPALIYARDPVSCHSIKELKRKNKT
jgi:hypothetical protein